MSLIRPSLRTLVFRLHWALGLTLGFVLAVLGATGALMSYEDGIRAWLDADIATVAVKDHPRLMPEALVARIEAQRPSLKIDSLTLSGDPTQASRARFARAAGSSIRPPSVYADPYDGSLRGEMRAEAAFATIRALHRWLLIPGDGRGWGRTFTGACTLSLLVFLGSGLYLRWPQIHRWRIWLKPNLARPGRPRWWSLHAVLGTWLAPAYLVIALSGLWWSYDAYRAGATWLLTGHIPAARAPRAAPREGPIALDIAWTAFAASAGRTASLATIAFPGEDTPAIRIRWLTAEGGQQPAERDEMTFDPISGTPIAIRLARDKALGQSMADNMLEVHRGRFFGSPVALVFFLASLGIPAFAATGLMLYSLRRRAKRRRSAAVQMGLIVQSRRSG